MQFEALIPVVQSDSRYKQYSSSGGAKQLVLSMLSTPAQSILLVLRIRLHDVNQRPKLHNFCHINYTVA